MQYDSFDLVHAALVEHYANWKSHDAKFLASFKDGLKRNQIDSVSLRNFTSQYGVGWHLERDREKEYSEIILQKLAEWRAKSSLTEKCRVVCGISREAQAKAVTNCFAASLASKTVWFLKPDNWTMYDNFAANGIGAHGNKSEIKMNNFYERLDAFEVSALWESYRKTLTTSSFRFLWPERITDKLLMVLGRPLRQFTFRFQGYGSAANPEDREALLSLATELAKITNGSQFWNKLQEI
jgi:hypothetical protein